MPPTSTEPEIAAVPLRASALARPARALALLCSLWAVLFFASLFAPSILDDADGTHANAARQMLLSHDWVTLRVNNVRYLEKAPLPYWLVAFSFRVFGVNTFAAHLPQALAVLLLMLLGVRWSRESFGDRAALYTGLAILTSAGVFLFTRIFLPDSLLSLLLAAALYLFLQSLHLEKDVILSAAKDPRISLSPNTPGAPQPALSLPKGLAPEMWAGAPQNSRVSTFYPYALWATLALAVLTKGLVALVFLLATAAVYLTLTGEYRLWRRLRPVSGLLLMTAIAAPWHILAGLRNTQGSDGHGFFWFYFINEHVLRFLGQRIPRDYNKLPGYLYWTLHLVWLFPWALFLGPLLREARLALSRFTDSFPLQSDQIAYWQPFAVAIFGIALRDFAHVPYLLTVLVAILLFVLQTLRRRQASLPYDKPLLHIETPAHRTTLLLTLFSAIVLLFFSLSTNQEYYTFPAYLPILILITAALARAEEQTPELPPQPTKLSAKGPKLKAARNRALATRPLLPTSYSLSPVLIAHAALTLLGFAFAAALAYGLWTSRHYAFVPDIGSLLAHRGVGDYTLSMSSLFDLTGPSFAALRLPAALALAAFALGPAIAWTLRRRTLSPTPTTRDFHLAATSTVALTSAVFLVAAHLALIRFAPMLSSADMARTILRLEQTRQIAPDATLLLFGDQAYGSSIPVYLNRPLAQPALLVDGRSSSMLFGSTFPDAHGLFLTPEQLLAQWGTGPRKLLFIPIERRPDAERLLAHSPTTLLQETSGKLLLTDRPLD